MPSLIINLRSNARKHRCFLLSLPVEMLVEELMYRLDVEDILRLRQASTIKLCIGYNQC